MLTFWDICKEGRFNQIKKSTMSSQVFSALDESTFFKNFYQWMKMKNWSKSFDLVKYLSGDSELEGPKIDFFLV